MSSSAVNVERKIQKKPVIIYLVPPKVIHADASEFMDLVQRLTGKSASSASSPPPPPPPPPDFVNARLQKSRSTSTTKPSRREFPVRVKARLALSRPPSDVSETTYSPSSFFSEFVGSSEANSQNSSNWLLHGGGQSHNSLIIPNSGYNSVESHNFIDIFQ